MARPQPVAIQLEQPVAARSSTSEAGSPQAARKGGNPLREMLQRWGA